MQLKNILSNTKENEKYSTNISGFSYLYIQHAPNLCTTNGMGKKNRSK